MAHVVVAGSSGFLGSHLIPELTSHGHRVTRLVRRAPAAGESRWDPDTERVDQEVIDGADVVINLAGSPTIGNPHSRAWARELRRSRVTSTRVLAEAIGRSAEPASYLAGNGISWYGDHGDDPCPETADSRGSALLTQVTREWQAATEPAAAAGARVAILRTSPVLDRRSAPLKQMLLPFRLGLGARLGDGRQRFPCISLRDWVGAVGFLVDSDVSGPVNLCCRVTPTNAEFTDALADAVGRKARLAAPAFVLDKAAGPMSPELLGSVNAVPQALLSAGYDFRDPDITAVLAAALG